MDPDQVNIRSVAVIGAGAAGLGAAWLLAKSGYQVHLYEAASRAGGHAHTIDLPIPNSSTSATVAVDAGFIVYNATTYPDLVSLFETLEVEEENSSMSFAASVQLPDSKSLFEWGSDSLTALFADRANLYRTSMYTMLYDVRRFNSAVYDFVHRLDTNPNFCNADITLAEFLNKGSYSTVFVRCYLIPMVSAVWSSSFDSALNFPARSLFHFFVNHGLAQIFARPQWRTPKKRSRDYVSRMLNQIRENGSNVTLSTPVTKVVRGHQNVTVYTNNCDCKHFAHIVFATHAPITLKILGDDATEDEKRILGAFEYSENSAFIHTDARLMPTNKAVWGAWNFIGRRRVSSDDAHAPSKADSDPVCVSYWLNKLQNLNKSPNPVPDMFLTLNPVVPIDPEKRLRQLTFEHPQFTKATVLAQQQIQTDLQGRNHSWFCGAYARYGFHEDALMTGLDVAEKLSGLEASRPWRSKQNMSINNHSNLYELPYSNVRSPLFFAFCALLLINIVLSRLQQGLGKIANRMADNVPVVVIAVGSGRLHKFGPRRKRKGSRSATNLRSSEDQKLMVVRPGNSERARITVKSSRVLVRIAEALHRGHDLAPTAAAAFSAGEIDCPKPAELCVALRALFMADRLYLEPSTARKGRAMLAEILLYSIVGGIQKASSLPTNTRLPELTTCVMSVVYPSWWLSVEESNDEEIVERSRRVSSVSTDVWPDEKPVNILEVVGDLSDITVSHLQRNPHARVTILVHSHERMSFVSRKAKLLSVGNQVVVMLVKDFRKQQTASFGKSSFNDEPKRFHLILSPALVNAYKSCGFQSLEEALVFLYEIATPNAIFELGCTVFGTRPLKSQSKSTARGSDSLFSGDDGFVLWEVADLVEKVEKNRFDLESISFLNHQEAAADVFEVIERVFSSLAADKLTADETRRVIAQMSLWHAALEAKYARRMTLLFRMA